MTDLSGKTALVLGSGRGLGRGIAECMGKAGANIATASRTIEQAQAVAQNIATTRGVKAKGYSTDITNSVSLE